MSASTQAAAAPGQPQKTVSVMVAIDGGDRLAKQWPSLCNGYLPAIIKQLGTVHQGADIQVGSITINSLPPTSRQPLVVRPFKPASAFVQSLPLLHSAKGKAKESTSDVDYALLEGLVVAATILEGRPAGSTYMIVISAQDIPTTNFWDEDVLTGGTGLPISCIWPVVLSEENPTSFSKGWNAFIDQAVKLRTHVCTVSTRYLPKLEELQRQVTARQGYSTQALPNLQDSEHAILLSGFSTGSNSNKRPHADSVAGQNQAGSNVHVAKKARPSPVVDARVLGDSTNSNTAAAVPPPAQQLQPPAAVPAEPPSQVEPPAQSTHPQSNQNLSSQELQMKRDEVRSQMKQFMQHLANMAKTQQITVEKAKATAEKVRAEAMKKLQLLDVLEQKQGGGNLAPPPQHSSQAVSQGPQQSPYQINNMSLPNVEQSQPPLVPQRQLSGQGVPSNRPPMHGRQQSFGSTPQQNTISLQQMQQQPIQHPSDPASVGSQSFQTPNFQTPQAQDGTPKAPGSPQKAGPPVWSGPIQWTFFDPQNKVKRDLAFYVDAIPIRPNATVELMNVQWPQTMEVQNISPMPMNELQRYAQDNRIQVVHFVKAPNLAGTGTTPQQNDALYQLLAKNLEGRSSVGVVKLPGVNRGIVIVALPGQSKLVGLVFLTTPLPPKTPGSGQSRQANPMQQQQQEAYQQLQQQQAQQFQAPPAINKTFQQPPVQPPPQLQPAFPNFQSPPVPQVPAASQYNYSAPPFQQQPQSHPPMQFQHAQTQQLFSAPPPTLHPGGNNGSAFTDAQFQEMLASMQRAQ